MFVIAVAGHVTVAEGHARCKANVTPNLDDEVREIDFSSQCYPLCHYFY
jgi:hypothetical protein